MATYTIGSDPRFHVGTTLFVYPTAGDSLIAGPSVTSSVVGSTGTTFTGLESSTRYAAAPSVTGPFVYFRTPAADNTDGAGVGGVASFDLIEDPDTGWPDRPEGAQAGTWIGWTDPTDLMAEYDRFIAIPEPD